MNDSLKYQLAGRRVFMTRGCGVLAACLSVPLWNLLGGCSGPAEKKAAGPLTVKIAELPLDRRVRLEHEGRAVEILRTAEGISARSLLCTHQGCNVQWRENEQVYFCPCHDGKFSAQGRPIYGPPREPLRELSVTLTSTEAIIGG